MNIVKLFIFIQCLRYYCTISIPNLKRTSLLFLTKLYSLDRSGIGDIFCAFNTGSKTSTVFFWVSVWFKINLTQYLKFYQLFL